MSICTFYYKHAVSCLRCLWLVVFILLFQTTEPLGAATVTIDGSQPYQLIDGFGVNANHRNWNNNELQPVLDALIDQGGMTLFRVLYDNPDWEAVNDNDDPNVMNWNYYNAVYSSPEFQKMWGLVGYLNQRGLNSGVSFNFQGGGPSWMGNPTLNPGYEAEWAEMVASLLIYARNNQHLQFDLVNPDNEPDGSAVGRTQGVLMTMDQYVTAMHKLAQLLDTNGLSDVRFVGPDLAYTSTTWLSAMMADPVLVPKLAHIGIHCYNDNLGGPSTGVYSFLQQSGHPDLNFWMTEFNEWCGSCEDCSGGDDSWSFARGTASYLLNHLANGASAGIVWEGYDSYYKLSGCWSYWGLFAVDNINAASKTYTPRKGFYTVAQISKFVRPGARRIDVSGYLPNLNLLAFYHPDSKQIVLTGVNSDSSPTDLAGTLANLPAFSSLDLYYTSSSTNLCWGGSVSVTDGTFTATLPGDCVFTLVASPVISVQITNPAEGASYSAPATISLQASALSAAGNITAVEFFCGTNRLGEADTAPYNLTWSNVPPGAYVLTARTSDSAGNSAVSPDVRVAVVGPLAQIRIIPTNAFVPPYGTQQFTATAEDALGTRLSPQPAFAWAINGGGSIDTNGIFSAGGEVDGPFTVTALSGGVSGTGSVSVASSGAPVLPTQTNQVVNELATLSVTNTATDIRFVTHLTTNTLSFSYTDRDALLADGWSFVATKPDGTPRDTEVTVPTVGALVSYDQSGHPGVLRIPCDQGDLWGSANDTLNSLFRGLPTNWSSLQLALSFAPVMQYQQAHLGLYQDDDNYLQVGVAYYNSMASEAMTLDVETDGMPNAFATVATSATEFYFRLEQSLADGSITGYGSPDGTNWAVLGTANVAFLNPRLAVWTGGSPVPYTDGGPTLDLQQLTVTVSSNTIIPTSLTYSLVSPPDGASIDTNGLVTWAPSEAQGPRTNLIVTVVTDTGVPSLSATNSFSVVVNEINTAPVLPAQEDRTIAGLQPLMVTNSATDADIPTNSLTYQLAEAPAGAAIDPNGVITWISTAAQAPSTNLFATVVTDYNPWAVNEQYLSATNSFMVVVSALVNGPTLPAQPDFTVNELAVLQVTNTAADDPFVSQPVTNTFPFSYTDRNALLADGWSFVGTDPVGTLRDTEITNPAVGAVVSYNQSEHPGVLRIPCDQGDLWGSANDTRNTLFHNLPRNWLSLQLALSFAPTMDYQQAHLSLYQDDDNYLQMGLAYNAEMGGLALTMDLETGGTPSAFVNTASTAVNLQFRLDQNPANGALTGLYSPDGTTWAVLGTTNHAFVNACLAIWTGGSPVPYTDGLPTLDVQQLDILSSSNVPTALTYTLLAAPVGASIDTNGVITWMPAAGQGPDTNLFVTVVTDNSMPPRSATNSFAVVVLVPPLPVLKIGAGTNGFVISWLGPLTNYILESTTDLSPGSLWVPVTNALQVIGGEQSVIILPVASQQFFRLRQH